jgi:hypothetical protein
MGTSRMERPQDVFTAFFFAQKISREGLCGPFEKNIFFGSFFHIHARS